MSQSIYLQNDPPNNYTNNLLFQVTFSNIDQFRNYPITEPNHNCFIQCLFALGLRKHHLVNQPNKGVTLKSAQHYLSKIFGLPSTNIKFLGTKDIRNEPGGHDNKIANIQIREFLDISLLDNHATIIMLCFARYGKHTSAHYMIAYKHNNIIHYFDPQNKGKQEDNKINSKTLLHIAKYSGNNFIYKLCFFGIKRMNEPKLLLDNDFPIRYI